MKTEVLLAAVALSCAPLAAGGNNAAYPSERVAEFVVAKLDLNSLPSAFRPRKEKAKKTFADYGFKAQTVDQSEAIVEAPGGGRGFKIKVLDQSLPGFTFALQNQGKTRTRQRRKALSCLSGKIRIRCSRDENPFGNTLRAR